MSREKWPVAGSKLEQPENGGAEVRSEDVEINGIKMSVDFYDSAGECIISFPQISKDIAEVLKTRETKEGLPGGSKIKFSGGKERAQMGWDYAKDQATAEDVYSLYREVEKFRDKFKDEVTEPSLQKE